MVSSELWTLSPPLYSINPSLRNLFMKKFTRERVVPTISASVSCESFGSTRWRRVLPPVSGEQQQRTGEPFLAGIEELIDQVFFDSDIARQHVLDEPVREFGTFVQQPNHVALRDSQERRPHDRLRRAHAQRLPGQAALTEEITRAEHGHDRLLASRRTARPA